MIFQTIGQLSLIQNRLTPLNQQELIGKVHISESPFYLNTISTIKIAGYPLMNMCRFNLS